MDPLPSVLWDYAQVAPPIIALIISVIAIWNPFTGESKWIKRCATVAAMVGILATIGIRHHELEVGERERQNAEQRLTTLGQLITEGDALQATINPSAPVNTGAINAWIVKTESFLSKELGVAFVSRFRDYSGLGTPQLPPNLSTTPLTGPHAQAWAIMTVRLARLQQFSEELSARIR